MDCVIGCFWAILLWCVIGLVVALILGKIFYERGKGYENKPRRKDNNNSSA